MKKLLSLTILLGLILTTWLPGCTGPEDTVPVDSTDYWRVADILRELEGDDAADEFLATADPGLVFLIEDTIEVEGSVKVSINDSLIFEGPNMMLRGMGENFAFAFRPDHGQCGVISGMTATITIEPVGHPYTVTMSAPTRTAGGRGANDYITVRSTWTNTTGYLATLDSNTLYIGTKSVAQQNGGMTPIPAADTLQVDWTISIPMNLCAYQTAIRRYMAQGINPESAWGGSLYTLSQGQWVFDVGNSGLLPSYAYSGGDGSTQQLLVEWQYIHSGANRTVQEFEVYNSNSNLASEKTGYGIAITAGDKLRGFHLAIYQGM